MAPPRRRGTWDREIDYAQAYREILEHARAAGDPRDAFLLVQLANGSRVGEAVEAVRRACELGVGPGGKVSVRVEKRRDYYERPVILPPALPAELLAKACEWLKGVSRPKHAIEMYALRAYGFNTHSLRYAFVTWAASQGVPVNLIAKMTGHKTIDHLITYTERRAAEELLARLASWAPGAGRAEGAA